MGSPKNKAKRIAAVYAGAAFLILVMGIKTIFQTWPDSGAEFSSYILPLLTTIAIIVEFILLNVYAITVASDTDDQVSSSATGGIDIDFSSLEKKIQSSIESQNVLSDELKKLNEVYTISSEAINKHAENVAKIGEGLESLVNEEVNRKVHAAISELISSKIS